MKFEALELELVALKQRIIGKVLARHGLRLTKAGRRAVSLRASFDAFRPEVVPKAFVERNVSERGMGLFRRLANWLKRWM